MAAFQEWEYGLYSISENLALFILRQISIRTVTGVLELSLSAALVVSSTELSEKEEDGRFGLLVKQWTSLSPSLSMPLVSRLNLHNITIQCLRTHMYTQ